MKIKIIELLNKIANGEKMPERIIYEGETYQYDEEAEDYRQDKMGELLFTTLFAEYSTSVFVNDFVIILEEHDDSEFSQNLENSSVIEYRLQHLTYKIDTLIDEIRKIEMGKNND